MPWADWTPRAEQDIDEIAYHIAIEDGRPATAEKNIRAIRDKAELYACQPQIGQACPDLAEGLFYGRHKRWLIFYEPSNNGITVHRVIDASRDYPRLFGASGP